MGPQFFQTRMGRAFFEYHVPELLRKLPDLIDALVVIGEELKSRREIVEKRLKDDNRDQE